MSLLWTGTMFPFLHSEGSTHIRRDCLKIISSGPQVKAPHIFSIWVLMLSWAYALLESRFWLILPIALKESTTVDKRFSVV